MAAASQFEPLGAYRYAIWRRFSQPSSRIGAQHVSALEAGGI